MIRFRTWLEAQISIGGVFKDGTIAFYVNGVRYVFKELDAAMFYNDKFAKLIDHSNRRYNPAAAFELVKKLVERGQAVQVEPTPAEEPKVQQSLFPM